MVDDVCEQCGEPAPADADFCLSCGAFLGWTQEADGSRARVGTQPGRPDGPAPAPDGRPDLTGPRPVPDGLRSDPDGRTAPPLPVAAAGTGDRRPAERLPVTAEPPAVGRPVPDAAACPRCGIDNQPQRRFCRRCGQPFVRAATTAAFARPRPDRPEPWWRRLFGSRRGAAERAALRAYRRSLPARYRVVRVVGVLVTLGLVAVVGVVTGGHPITWTRDRWADVFGSLQPVAGVVASLDPPSAAPLPEYAAANAVDGVNSTAWAAQWVDPTVPAGRCGLTPTTAALLLQWPEPPADLRRIELVAGLPDGDRLSQWRPKLIELRFSDGTCRTLPVRDTAEPQTIPLDPPVNTSLVRVDVIDGYPPREGVSDRVAISEIRLWRRPPR